MMPAENIQSVVEVHFCLAKALCMLNQMEWNRKSNLKSKLLHILTRNKNYWRLHGTPHFGDSWWLFAWRVESTFGLENFILNFNHQVKLDYCSYVHIQMKQFIETCQDTIHHTKIEIQLLFRRVVKINICWMSLTLVAITVVSWYLVKGNIWKMLQKLFWQLLTW